MDKSHSDSVTLQKRVHFLQTKGVASQTKVLDSNGTVCVFKYSSFSCTLFKCKKRQTVTLEGTANRRSSRSGFFIDRKIFGALINEHGLSDLQLQRP